jgi:broad specificity phosphatase PhoE
MSVQITYYVHGTTPDNEEGLATGQADTPLSERGIDESHKLHNLTKDLQFDAVYASDLVRASETARIAFGDRYTVIFDARLREFNDGDFTRHPVAEMCEHEVQYIDERIPGGESYRDVEKRIVDFMEDVKKLGVSHIAIVAHRFPQLSLEVLCNGKTWEQALDEDWRKTKSWQPGWSYTYSE